MVRTEELFFLFLTVFEDDNSVPRRVEVNERGGQTEVEHPFLFQFIFKSEKAPHSIQGAVK
jgi:hypothetical protein